VSALPVVIGRLEELEADIERERERGRESFLVIGARLEEIRSSRLYKDGGYWNWDDYCITRWGMSGRHANRLISALLFAAELGPGGPESEGASRQERARRLKESTGASFSGDEWQLFVGDLASVDVTDASLDVIVTDPPYPAEFLPEFDKLGAFAAAKLHDGGSLVCMSGQSYLPQVIASLYPHLVYQWTAAYLTPGGQAVQLWDRKVNTFWKPLLWFVKGEYTGDWIGDVCKSDVNDNDKRFHDWGQSESGMVDVLRRFTRAGDLVCDPFCGGGTTGIAALSLGRRFLGIDRDEQSIATTSQRLNEASP
jgi:site-specific DNA-methyltransferase (adenine-specific)